MERQQELEHEVGPTIATSCIRYQPPDPQLDLGEWNRVKMKREGKTRGRGFAADF